MPAKRTTKKTARKTTPGKSPSEPLVLSKRATRKRLSLGDLIEPLVKIQVYAIDLVAFEEELQGPEDVMLNARRRKQLLRILGPVFAVARRVSE